MYKTYSVLMSVYYKEKACNLYDAIESMMKQTIKTDDFVLVCDGPLTEELEVVINAYQSKYSDIFHVVRLTKNLGLGNALNLGISYCRNDLVARMDSDDISDIKRCELQIAYFNTIELCDVLSGTVAEFTENPQMIICYKTLPESDGQIRDFAKQRNPVNHPCVMYKKKSVLAAGSYQSFYFLEDYYLWLRMLQKRYIFHNLKETLVYMRTNDELYKRRSGRRYVFSQLKLKYYMWNTGYINFVEFIYGASARYVIATIPNSFRKKIYNMFLRKFSSKS